MILLIRTRKQLLLLPYQFRLAQPALLHFRLLLFAILYSVSSTLSNIKEDQLTARLILCSFATLIISGI